MHSKHVPKYLLLTIRSIEVYKPSEDPYETKSPEELHLEFSKAFLECLDIETITYLMFAVPHTYMSSFLTPMM